MAMTEITLWSQRFNKAIRLTHHAKARMQERHITETVLLDLIEQGEIQFKDDKHGWIFKTYSDRNDNFICVLDNTIIVKTVMINWQLEE